MGGSAMCGSQGNLRMFSLDCPGRQSAPRVVAFATANASSFDSSAGVGVAVFLSYWLDGPTQKVELRVNLQTHATKATLYRIDGDHANAAKLWHGLLDVNSGAVSKRVRRYALHARKPFRDA